MFHLLLSRANTTAMSRLELPVQVNPELLRRAAELRQHMTPEEQLVWQELRGNRLGVHFRRQHPLAPYIVDFYCHQAHLVVEIDGSPHRQQQGYDRLRDAYLARFGDSRTATGESFGPR